VKELPRDEVTEDQPSRPANEPAGVFGLESIVRAESVDLVGDNGKVEETARDLNALGGGAPPSMLLEYLELDRLGVVVNIEGADSSSASDSDGGEDLL